MSNASDFVIVNGILNEYAALAGKRVASGSSLGEWNRSGTDSVSAVEPIY